jgi:hypothetical protein
MILEISIALSLGFVLGIIFVIGYGAYRALNSEGWDDSNVNNWLRLLSHVFIHPQDFSQMYYLGPEEIKILNASQNYPYRIFSGV